MSTLLLGSFSIKLSGNSIKCFWIRGNYNNLSKISKLFTTGTSQMWSHLKHHLYHDCQIVGVVRRQMRIKSPHNFLEKALHVVSPEWRLKGNGLIKYTPQRPNIWFLIICLVFPDLWACIVRCSRLCLTHRFDKLRHIKIPKFGLTIFVKKDIGTLDISMEDLHIM